jgi:hypothetical protein
VVEIACHRRLQVREVHVADCEVGDIAAEDERITAVTADELSPIGSQKGIVAGRAGYSRCHKGCPTELLRRRLESPGNGVLTRPQSRCKRKKSRFLSGNRVVLPASLTANCSIRAREWWWPESENGYTDSLRDLGGYVANPHRRHGR